VVRRGASAAGPDLPPSFTAVLQRAQAGDTASFEHLFTTYQPLLLRYLRGCEAPAAEDCCGEVWLAVAKGLRKFRGDESHFRAWVFTIARNQLAEYRRRAVRRAHLSAASLDTESLEAGGLSGGTIDSTGTEAVDEIVLRSLSGQEAVDLLRVNLLPDQLDVVLLRVLAGLEISAIAEMLGHSENWVRVTHHRALQRLSARIGHRLGPSTGDSGVTP
jgi:RNA polymerase sigma-70 factor, ECF subfamily